MKIELGTSRFGVRYFSTRPPRSLLRNVLTDFVVLHVFTNCQLNTCTMRTKRYLPIIFPTGLFFVYPCVDSVTTVDMRTQTYDINPQEVSLITRYKYATERDSSIDNLSDSRGSARHIFSGEFDSQGSVQTVLHLSQFHEDFNKHL